MTKPIPHARETLIDAAEHLLVHSREPFSIPALARACHMGTGTVYGYFKSSADLVDAVIDKLWVEAIGRIDAAIDDHDSFKSRIDAIDSIMAEYRDDLIRMNAQIPIHETIDDLRHTRSSRELRARIDRVVAIEVAAGAVRSEPDCVLALKSLAFEHVVATLSVDWATRSEDFDRCVKVMEQFAATPCIAQPGGILTLEDIKRIAAFLPGGVVFYRVEGTTMNRLHISGQITGLSGLSRGALEDTDAMSLIARQDRARIAQSVRRMVQTGEDLDAMYRVARTDGGYTWVHGHGRIVGTMDGKPVVLATLLNATSENAQQVELLDYTPNPIYVIDRETYEILYINRAFQNLFGKYDIAQGKTCYDYKHGFSAPCSWCPVGRMRDAHAEMKNFYNTEISRWCDYYFQTISWFDRNAVAIYAHDITSHKEAEARLRNGRAELRSAVNSAKIVVWEYDIANHRATFSDDDYTVRRSTEMGFGHVIENVPDSVLDRIDEASIPALKEMYRKVEAGEDATCEVQYKIKPGEEPHFERYIYTVERNSTGKPLFAHGMSQNISEERNAQARYELAFKQLSDAYPTSLESFHLNLTRNWCGEGRSSLDFVLKQQEKGTVDGYFEEFAAIIADEDIRTRFLEDFDRKRLLDQFQQGVTQRSIEYPIVYDDGIRHWRRGLLFMIKNPITEDVEAVTYAIDIDTQKHNEFILNIVTGDEFDYVGLVHPSTKTLEILNRKPSVDIAEVGSQADADAQRLDMRDSIVAEEDRPRYTQATKLDQVLEALRRTGEYTVSYACNSAGGNRRKQLRYRWLEVPEGDILLTRSDVTDAYKQEQERIHQLQDAVMQAAHANDEKSMFLSSMSHDLRTPLNGVIGFTEIALQCDDLDQVKHYLANIKSSGALLLDLVNDTLELSHIESGKMKLEPEITTGREIAESILTALRPSADLKHITLVADIDTLPARPIWVDKLKLQKVFLNILSNAIKYTPQGGTITASWQRLDPPIGGYNSRIVVEDTGIGIEPSFMPYLFEPFRQENRPEAANVKGTGLGLSIVKRIVDAMGGRISVESEPERGTKFTVDLMVRDADAEQALAVDVHRDLASLAGKRVLLCEDNDMNAEIASILLSDRQMLVDRATNGAEAVQMFSDSAEGFYDFVLMDIRMPKMNGRDAARAIRSLERFDSASVPIIAMTADAFEEDFRANREAGMNGQVIKPISQMHLFEGMLGALN